MTSVRELRLRAQFAVLVLLVVPDAMARPLSHDERVIFIPSTARLLDQQRIEVRVEAWVYELERRPGLTHTFADYLGLDLDELSAAERELFYRRTQLFRVDSESSKDLRVRIDAGEPMVLPRTGWDGRSRARLIVAAGSADNLRVHTLVVNLVSPPGDAREFSGSAVLVPPVGVSVISDIDDTIKHSNVRDRHELLLNTFARQFVAVPDMAQRYRDLATGPDAVAFHYVSAGPIQLLPPLLEFLQTSGFPNGSMHLRESTSIGNVVPSDTDARTHKLAVIRALLNDFPQRHFILIGDSGEADPEVYAEIAREFPQRILAIHIRDVTGESREAARYRSTFAEVPASHWSIFVEPPAFAPDR